VKQPLDLHILSDSLPTDWEQRIDTIEIAPDRLRHLDAAKVEELAASIREHGLISPIIVRGVDDGARLILVAGLHRLEAVKRLGLDSIKVIFVEGNDIEVRLLEITENLHRAELTATERAEHVAEWIRLTDERRRRANASQVETHKKGQQPGGVNAAARDLNIGKAEAHRAVKIAAITPEAKEAAKAAGLDDNQSALLKIASYGDADQVEAVADIVAEKARAKAEHNEAAASIADKYISRNGAVPVVETRLGLFSAWSAASPEERAAFMREVDDDAIVAALTQSQLRAAALLWKRMDEQARRQARTAEEAERVKAADRARKSKGYLK
jgi:ParB family chromosome partitioning protein